jgi:ATP-dependent Lon protease
VAEVIELVGYTQDEKLAIARDFLIPKQLSEHGLTAERLEITDQAVDAIIDGYTGEAGVRQLEQKIAALCRAVAVRLAEEGEIQVSAGSAFVEEVLGPSRFDPPRTDKLLQPGVSMGLAWTAAGGDLLFVESTRMPGSGKVHLTGRMGDIMKESVAAALTYVRARSSSLGLPDDFLSKIDIHLHLPHGAVPKDGPSHGIAIFVSLASALTRIRTRPDVAMTGEITLRGSVLKVGGIKQKCLAAHRAGVKHVILPARNEPEVEEVPEHVRSGLKFHFVSKVSEVLELALDIPRDRSEPASFFT